MTVTRSSVTAANSTFSSIPSSVVVPQTRLSKAAEEDYERFNSFSRVAFSSLKEDDLKNEMFTAVYSFARPETARICLLSLL